MLTSRPAAPPPSTAASLGKQKTERQDPVLDNSSVSTARQEVLLPASNFPFGVGISSLAGRKHYYSNGALVLNEDCWDLFSFEVPRVHELHAIAPDQTEVWAESSDETPVRTQERWCLSETETDTVYGWYIADGHGQSIGLPTNGTLDPSFLASFPGSGAERFCRLLKNELPNVAAHLTALALTQVTAKTSDDDNGIVTHKELLITALKSQYSQFHDAMNERLASLDYDLLRENGSTLCLALVYRDNMFCLNVGDSSMMAFTSSGDPLNIWQREGIDKIKSICSYEDTLAYYPKQIREGQTMDAVGQDFERIRDYTRTVTNGAGMRYYPIFSNLSPYGLAMTNTLGNLHHQGRTFSRTSVYHFDLSSLLSESDPVVFAFVSDGIKDVLNAGQIGAFLASLEHGLNELSGLEYASIDDVLSRISCGTDRHSQRATDHIKSLLFEQSAMETLTENNLDVAAESITRCAILRGSYDDVTCLMIQIDTNSLGRIKQLHNQTPSQVATAAESEKAADPNEQTPTRKRPSESGEHVISTMEHGSPTKKTKGVAS